MAPRRPLPLQLWVVGTLALVLSLASGALWWERQLPGRLRQALDSGDWSRCLELTEQLAALRWLGEGAPQQQARCRRQRAAQLWNSGDQAAALQVQRQLVQSDQASATDVEQIQVWRRDLREGAMQRFRAGDLEGSIAMLEPLDRAATNGGNPSSDSLRETWNRNRLEAERLTQLVDQQRWWEALDSLNRLDHPWWQNRSEPNRRLIETAIRQLRDTQEHQPHGSTDPDVISGDELETTVQTHLQAGMDPWNAFQSGCADLGGRVIEDGPESFCRREAQNSP